MANNCETSSYSNNGVQKLKGVVAQQNGHWGAQIYANHQRIWLGTFKSEREAAMAYDSAAIKLRSGESHRNFPWNHHTVLEPQFQSHYSTEAVLTMIRDASYPSKFASFLRSQTQSGEGASDDDNNNNVREQFCCTQLFQKELTPSDVGKLNRLVIPKKHAVTYFPFVCGGSNELMDGVDMEVVFYDRLMRSWKFRYCYWKSSQSYVFTRGWNRFVKDKKLKAKDMVAFYVCQPSNCRQGGQLFSLIDVIYNADHDHDHGDGKQLMGGLSEGEDQAQLETKDMNEVRGLRLFGVCIN